MRASALLSLLRPVGPVVVGISLGFTLSLLSVTWVEEPCDSGGARAAEDELLAHSGSLKGARKPNYIFTAADADEDLEPRIVPYTKPAQSPARKVYRAKYASTELGIRERLFVGVLTSKSTLNTLGVAVNRTLSHRLDGHLVFFTGTRNRKVPHGMTVVTHGDDRRVLNMFQSISYLLEHYIDEYDWFYLVQDDVYTQPDRLKTLVGHLSMVMELYMGWAEVVAGEPRRRFCSGRAGYLLSHALLLKLRPFLEPCRSDIISVRPDEWLGRCLSDYTGAACTQEHQGLQYQHFVMEPGFEISQEVSKSFQNALTVHPVSSPELMYRLHKHFTEIELQRTYNDIKTLQEEIRNVSEMAVDGNRSTLWPVGVSPPFEPKSRFEVLRWDYFTEEQLFSCNDGSPKCGLHGADRDDINDVIQTAIAELNRKYSPDLHLAKQRLLNGYRRFDPTRGMEYTLDLQLEARAQAGRSTSLTKRVHLVRPLSQVEIIPMPYVTEATRVHVLLPLVSADRMFALRFLDLYASNVFETGENAVLTFLFIYDPLEAQRVGQNDIFTNVKSKVAAYERKYPSVKVPWISVKTESPALIRILDIVSRKHPVDTLFFLATADTVVSMEFLNRCRMNAISGWQAFFPIHFQDYNPQVAYHDQPPPTSADVVREAGHFDRYAFEEACFYNADYMAARTRLAGEPQDNRDTDDLLDTLDVYDVFVHYSGLHVFRAVEPSLHQRYRNRTCNPRLSEESFHRCMQSMLEGLGSRSQLAMLLFEQEQGNST
ncbi:chondroitin sulfate synthase 2-like [Denticeps clupeoides]|uniref:Hexosyltransferase n=1 Tax=Denticeps clupeoides TaxID=299321 RepID=A0AAY4AUX6_9TELE|nr:chondroitin sulfate synthase 2 [Denticeps clupeoides]